MLSSATLLLPILLTFVAAQRVFIDKVPAYASLPHCAEVPLSFIVRDMASGCGDGGKTTSYSCFCTDSSSKMNRVISTAVSSRCSTGPAGAATEAVDVFASYCALGDVSKYIGANATQAATANATATVTRTVTPSATTSVPEQTAFSPIPSNLAVGSNDGKGRALCAAMAAIVALGAFW